ncbi:MAG TPA: hypothetical protein VI733_00535 [Candidatus Limnocylindria bacterium]|nr:hypothetical protein [Candidatus Limnocylindria bacterium]
MPDHDPSDPRPDEDDPGVGIDFGRRLRPILALGGLFSGVALLLYLLAGVSLNLALLVTSLVLVGALVVVLRLSTAAGRRWVLLAAFGGLASGLVATIAYDVAKTALSQLDPSPYDPFHAIAVFGELILGSQADATPIVVAGAAFHLLNGSSFGVAYAFLFARDGRITVRRALATGITWGLFLETFQLTLYPGWLDIRFYQEFVTISALGHVVYGATLGLLARIVLQRLLAERD